MVKKFKFHFFFQVKRNKELIATNIQEIYNPMAVAQISQPIDLQQLFMHQLQQQQILPGTPGILPTQTPLDLQQQQLQLLQIQQQTQNSVSFKFEFQV